MKITIGGLAGVGTSTIGRMLAKKYEYNFYSGGNLFRKAAQEHGMTMEEFDHYMTTHPEYDKEIDALQAKIGEEDNFVLESRIGWYFIPDAHKIKLNCDLDVRVQRIVDSKGKGRIAYEEQDFEATKLKTLDREETHRKRIEKLYGIENLADDTHYDLVVDTTDMTPDEIVAYISKNIEQ